MLVDCILAASEEQMKEANKVEQLCGVFRCFLKFTKAWTDGFFIPMIARFDVLVPLCFLKISFRLNMDGVLLGPFHALLEQAVAGNVPAHGIMQDKVQEDIELLYKATE